MHYSPESRNRVLRARNRSKQLWAVAPALLVVAGLALLVGCQGVSAGPADQQNGILSVLNSTLAFGSVQAGTTKTLSATVTNLGTTSVTVSSVSFSTQYFSLVSPSLPVTVAAGQSVPVNVQFKPNAAGSFNATVTITSDASPTTTTFAVSGTGTATDGQLALNPASEAFGNVDTGSTASVTVTLTNSGGTAVNVSQASISGTGFKLSGITTPLTVNPSQNTTFTVSFAPTTGGSVTGTVTITSDASNSSLTMPLTGTGVAPGALTSTPTSLTFGSIVVGNNSTLTDKLTNTGATSITISQVSASGTVFSVSGITTPMTLSAGQSTNISVKFAPTATGSASGSVTVTSTASNPTLTVPLSGTGTSTPGTLTASPATLNLGSVQVGDSGTGSGSLTASGASVTVTAASSNNSQFVISGLTLPVTIPAGQSTPYTVTFSPTAAATVNATLTFTSNAQPTTTTEAVTGTGTPAPVHSVNLSWNASSSQNISGYNIYRAVYTTACGSFGKINALLNTGTLYTDSNVANGTSYCYAATAVNTSNEESGYSNIISNLQIP